RHDKLIGDEHFSQPAIDNSIRLKPRYVPQSCVCLNNLNLYKKYLAIPKS
ncbi:hypothetical protein L9F63_011982, partial [Diploptera punctata]